MSGLVVAPLIIPLGTLYGIHPVQLGIIFLANLQLGYMTPPVGLNLFISSFRFNKPITQLYRSVLPFIGLLGLALIIVTYIPILSTWLPNMVESNAVKLDSPEDEMDEYDLDLDALEGDDDTLDLDSLEGDDDTLDLDSLAGEEEELDLDSLEEDQELDLDAIEEEQTQ